MHTWPDYTESINLRSNAISANVLVISLHADPVQPGGSGEGGGTHAYLRELLRNLAINRRYCTIITHHALTELPAFQRLSDFTSIHRIKLGDVAPIDKRLLNNFHFKVVEQIKQIIKLSSWPVHILHGVYWNSGRAAMELSENLGIPFVQTVISNGKRRLVEGFHDNAEERIKTEAQVFNNATAVFCISGEEKEDLVRLYGVNPNKLFVVGRPVPLPYLLPAQKPDGSPRLVNLHCLQSLAIK